jgi:hypothetical protein
MDEAGRVMQASLAMAEAIAAAIRQMPGEIVFVKDAGAWKIRVAVDLPAPPS